MLRIYAEIVRETKKNYFCLDLFMHQGERRKIDDWAYTCTESVYIELSRWAISIIIPSNDVEKGNLLNRLLVCHCL